MSKVIKECKDCARSEKGHDRPTASSGHHSLGDCVDIGALHTSALDAAAKQEADDLLEKLRSANKQIVLQSQRIEELESYLHCIVSLSARVRELELDASL